MTQPYGIALKPVIGASLIRLLAILILLVLVVPRVGAQSDLKVVPEVLLKNLDFPDALAFAPGGRIFFNEKTGSIRVIQNGNLETQPFAKMDVVSAGEQGLLGLALHPNFASNGFLYVYYTYSNGTFFHSRIRRYTAVGNIGTNPTDIFDLTNPTGSRYHNGGYMKFGPDGKLYVQVGEFQRSTLSQDLSTYAGKILRMNGDGSVPSDNPFKGSLVYAYGVRNAFGMDFDPTSGMLIATEAGPDTDEINIITAGANYGWPQCIGVCNNPAYKDPILTFNPATTPTGITYASPNTFYFGEWSTADLKRLQLTPNGKVASVEQVFALSTSENGIVAVERSPDGNIYFSTATAIYVYRLNPQQPLKTTTRAEYVYDLRQATSLVAVVVVGVIVMIGWLLYRKKPMQSRKSEQT